MHTLSGGGQAYSTSLGVQREEGWLRLSPMGCGQRYEDPVACSLPPGEETHIPAKERLDGKFTPEMMG